MNQNRRPWHMAAWTYAYLLEFTLLWPIHIDAGGPLSSIENWLLARLSDWPPTAFIDYNLLEATANVILFIPVGVFALKPLRLNWRKGMLATLTISTAAELIQLLLLSGRTFSVQDIIHNSLGGAIGYLAVSIIALKKSSGYSAIP